MENKKSLYLFTAGIVAILLGGGGILGAMLSGCFNPVLAGPPVEETVPARNGGQADPWTEPESFAVRLRIHAPASSLGSRSLAGTVEQQMSFDLQHPEGYSIRNFVQLVVLDSAGKIVFTGQKRREDNSAETEFRITGFTVEENYHFFLLIGHWERDYAAENSENEDPEDDEGKYQYLEDNAPTLLLAGLTTEEITGGEQTIIIYMHPILVDTQFISANPSNIVEPLITADGNPRTALLSAHFDSWDFKWTVKGARAYLALKKAQDIATSVDSGGLSFYSKTTTWVKNDEGPYHGDPATWPVIISWTPPDSIPVADSIFNSLIGGLSVTQTIGKVSATESGWGYFNLEYIPCNITDPGAWKNADSSTPEESAKYQAFYTQDGLPRWIIRNGINNKPQDDGTYFDYFQLWNGRDYAEDTAAINGNGGVRFRGTSLDIKAISSIVLSYFVADEGSDGTGDGSEAKPFATVEYALEALMGDYGAWQDSVNKLDASDLKAWGVIYVKGTVPLEDTLIIDGTYPPLNFRSKPADGGTLKLATNTHIRVAAGGNLTLGGALTLQGPRNNDNSAIIVEGSTEDNTAKLTLDDLAVITDNKTAEGGGVSVKSFGEFTMAGGEIKGNTAATNGGGVSVAAGGVFAMTGGMINNNTAENGYGGGVYVDNGGKFSKTNIEDDPKTGGTIMGDTSTSANNPNIASEGKAVYVNCYPALIRNSMAGPTINLSADEPAINWEENTTPSPSPSP